MVLEKFLTKLSTEREKPKHRVRPKSDITWVETVHLPAPDGRKTFIATEEFIDGVYERTGAFIEWPGSGGSVFYFKGNRKHLAVKWQDSQTLEVTHDKNFEFLKQDNTFYFYGDAGVIVYIPVAPEHFSP